MIVRSWERLLKATKTRITGAEGPDARPFESLAAIWLLQKRRRFYLEETGLNLDDEKKEDLLDLGVMVMPGLGWFMNDDDLGDIIQGFLTRIITDESEPISDEEEDFISRGRFSMNILPLDVDIKGRIEAIGHYSKVLILDKPFQGWQKGRENGQRLDDQLDRRTCLSPGWKMMLEHLGKEGQDWLGQNEGAVMWEVRTLLFSLRRVRE
ncbi:hypothetical protein B0J15DRAFT_514441 [Fusarium solani]|uniref:Uncharacterized protein n=1 Tax=Fusarium solani TaxID=169388 RepID=A0A9P9K565_FUSSL|nr:uncharacterized protein B0J15DRAFT_514441 [Fusarium solani]KAH7248398.1 hypothetical protein B0J15DRAFT_514441 [Fusarium solani]